MTIVDGSPAVVAVVGNPRANSRTRRVAELVAERLARVVGAGTAQQTIELAAVAPALVTANNAEVDGLKARARGASALVVASPTYKAAYTGLLKLFLDQFDAGELAGLPTVAVMTGGSPAHALAVDVHLAPVLLEIGASCPARGLYVYGADQDDPAAAVDRWWVDAAKALSRALGR